MRERERTGPDATIRPTLVHDTWAFRLRMLSNPHEARCHLCPADHADGYHGPDTLPSCERWVADHLMREHGIVPVHTYDVTSGNERWP